MQPHSVEGAPPDSLLVGLGHAVVAERHLRKVLDQISASVRRGPRGRGP